ncbi:MAG: outer membrane protein transport protein [Candidatus Fermentibacteraceae bacterium]|nr:outer membrane protein transport protein [Candidatus Fermentibacteraceae bacterium]MBN2609164.1 outer membrane protein transport protein [Candidatus Fermentibacteraceae bacterium]
MRILAVLLLATLFAGLVYGSNIDYLTNRSVNYFRNFARNPATEGADLVTYNPAGLVFMDEGFHISLGNQFLLKDYTIEAVPFWDTTTTETYESTEPTLFLPDLYTVYRTGQWAVFGAFTVPAGGGSLDYKDGIYAMPLIETGFQQAVHMSPYYFALMDQGSIRASSQYLAGTFGASYAATDIFSIGLAGRYINAKRSYDGMADFTIFGPDSMGSIIPVGTASRVIDVEKSASGFGGVISFDIMPTPDLNVAIRYETATELEFETTVNENSWEVAALPDSSFTDGYKQRRDLPAIIAGGVSYRFSPQFKLSTTFNYYLVEAADQGDNDGLDDDYENGLDIGIGFDYQISPRLLGGLAYLRSDLGGSEETFSDLEYNLSYNAIGGGLRYAVNDDFALTLAGGGNFYEDGTGSGIYQNNTYSKSVWYCGLGAEFSFR